jgi:hypothetical protein
VSKSSILQDVKLSRGILCRVVVFHPTRCELTCSGLAWYPTYGLGLWIAWQGTLCTDWDGGWFGKVPGVRNRLWLVPGV